MTSVIVGYAGMSHLGLNSAVAAAERGFDVICFDPDKRAIASLAEGKSTVSEPGLVDLMARNATRMRFTSNAGDLAGCAVLYVSQDVSTDDAGVSNLAPVRALLDVIATGLRSEMSLVVLSQVSPGFCRSLGHKRAQTFYQVETLIFGRAVERALNPERFIVGCADPAIPLPTPYRNFLEAFGCPILTMRYESAELAKIAINIFLVSSVSTTNMLAEICEKIGADWNEIGPALRLDRRIGQYAYLNPGLGIAGGNLERDLTTIVRIGDEWGTDVGLVRAWRTNSRYRRDWVLRAIHAANLPPATSTLGLLGLAYKENTNSTKNSPALALLAALTPYRINAYDPVVAPRADWHPRLRRAESALDVCTGANALIVMTPWPEFSRLDPRDIVARLKGRLVIDPFACLDREACQQAGLIHLALGAAP